MTNKAKPKKLSVQKASDRFWKELNDALNLPSWVYGVSAGINEIVIYVGSIRKAKLFFIGFDPYYGWPLKFIKAGPFKPTQKE